MTAKKDNPKKRIFPMVTDEVRRHLEKVGDGNISLGIEILAKADMQSERLAKK